MATSQGVTIRRAEADDATSFHACLDSGARTVGWCDISPNLRESNPRVLDGRVEDIVCMALLLREPATLGTRSLS